VTTHAQRRSRFPVRPAGGPGIREPRGRHQEPSGAIIVPVTALKAHVRNGRSVVDEPIDLPEGAEVSVYLYDASADDLPVQERAALGRALERGVAQADAGELIDADLVLADLEQP